MDIIVERLDALTTGKITLDHGSHGTFDRGHCALEVVAWLADEGHTDAPECASPVLRRFTINLNDSWSQEQRQKLIPFLPRMVGTAGDGQDEARSYLALDWLIRTYTPAWLDLAGLTVEAQELRDLRRIVDMVTAEAAGPVVRNASDKAAAAYAAGAAARAAARVAARVAAGATGAAADAAARAAAGAAADAAARAAARAAADAAGGAADAAGESAWRTFDPVGLLAKLIEVEQTA